MSTALAALVLAAAGAAANGTGGACASRCGFEVSPAGFLATGAGAEKNALTARVGARVVWRLKRRALGQPDAHTVSSDKGFFRSPLLRNAVGEAVFWRRTTSAGVHRFHDSVGSAGNGSLVVLPTLTRVPGGIRATWAAPGSNLGNAYSVRYELLDELDTVEKGWIWGTTATRSYTFLRGYRLDRAPLKAGLLLCVEARTGLIGEGFSDWARNCAQL
jgi:hypothetical protein